MLNMGHQKKVLGRLVGLGKALCVAFAILVFAPAFASAQSSITGVVRDASGGVLPGVTVEVSSPALIERVRSAVSDDTGTYRVNDLRPGTYAVVFTLPGFSTVRREGLQLSDLFTATVNADLTVGSLEETITVTGQTPLVDTQSVVTRQTLNSDLVDSLPSARLINNLVLLQPGVSGVRLGASQADQRTTTIHGGRETAPVAIDGFSTNFVPSSNSSNSSFYMNVALAQEVTIQTSSGSAESQWGTIQSNVIPKEGGNNFTGYLFSQYTNESMQGNNISQALIDQGIRSVSRNNYKYNVVPAVGGPIVKDKLWFYSAFQKQDINLYRGDMFDNATPLGWSYTPNLNRPAPNRVTDGDWSMRLTLQATPRNKFMVFFDQQPHIIHQRNGTSFSPVYAPEATNTYRTWPNAVYTAVWKSPVSNRLFVEAGAGQYSTSIATRPSEDPGYSVDPYSIIPALETTTNMCFRASGCNGAGGWDADPYNVALNSRATANYVTGSHSFKVGFQSRFGRVSNNPSGKDYTYTLTNAVPISITQLAYPSRDHQRLLQTGLFAMDTWTFNRVTLNLGLRFDQQHGWVPANDIPAGTFVPARKYPEITHVPFFRDLSPRIGVAYDLFGNGRTALKGSANRYTETIGVDISRANDPLRTTVTSVTRTWADADRDYAPDCDLNNTLANGECGTVSDLNFGKPNPRSLGWNKDILSGFGVGPSEWEYSAQVQQEVMSGLSTTVGYFRRVYANFRVVDNLDVAPADYDTYCVTAPLNPNLPGGGGYRVCDLFDVKPAKFGQVRNQTNSAESYPGGDKQHEYWQGVDVGFSSRMSGLQVSGGLSTGRRSTDACAVVDTATTQYCDTTEPFSTQFKMNGSYSLPWWGIQVSGTFINIPAQFLTATAIYTNAQILPSLGRNLSAGANGRVTVNLIQPNTVFHPDGRQTQIDLKLSRVTEIGKYRLTTGIEFFNLTNGTGVQQFNNRVGPTYPSSSEIQFARYAQLMAQLTF